MSALISDCGKYRYWLRRPARIEHPTTGPALFVMLNPSTADAELDDPTIRRCRGFADSWDCAGIVVANLYAYRATKPTELWRTTGPIGPDNDDWLYRLLQEHGEAVCAWGANAEPERAAQFMDYAAEVGARLWCLGTTKTGAPRHPLYVRADQPLVEFRSTPADGGR
ncbi:DUF1643 domain-containing protein [Parahaliea mediterranea]|uniref:DUF1643 domain-containing protein n=1 Tax=Parahaliea mediterranea TaxID=651086 RepID=UPI000E2E59FB|nr:DUF1643 domain-containing protein [Parahaliea mediterranea]